MVKTNGHRYGHRMGTVWAPYGHLQIPANLTNRCSDEAQHVVCSKSRAIPVLRKKSPHCAIC